MLNVSKLLTRLSEPILAENRNVILSLCEKASDAKLLDLGCGDEEITMKVSERVGATN